MHSAQPRLPVGLEAGLNFNSRDLISPIWNDLFFFLQKYVIMQPGINLVSMLSKPHPLVTLYLCAFQKGRWFGSACINLQKDSKTDGEFCVCFYFL